MSSAILNYAREYLVAGLDIAKRRWLLLMLPILIGLAMAVVAVKVTPKNYTAKSLVLLQSASRGGLSQQNVYEQVAAIEAWLKSDHVLSTLLPQIMEIDDPDDAEVMTQLMQTARASISLTLLSASALEVSYQDSVAQGLAHKLEIILARIMEGVTGPERGILNASQFVLLSRNDTLRRAELELRKAIQDAGGAADSFERITGLLEELDALRAAPGSASDEATASRIEQITRAIPGDDEALGMLGKKYAAYRQALTDYNTLGNRLINQESNYVGIFDTAENILIVGRPQDPIYGESPGKKIAIAIFFLSILSAAALAGIAELLHTGVRTRAEFETLTGLPVVARFEGLPGKRPRDLAARHEAGLPG